MSWHSVWYYRVRMEVIRIDNQYSSTPELKLARKWIGQITESYPETLNPYKFIP